MTLTIKNLDKITLSPMLFLLETLLFPADEVCATYQGANLRLVVTIDRIIGYAGYWRIFSYQKKRLKGHLLTSHFGPVGKILEFLISCQNNGSPQGQTHNWSTAQNNGYHYLPNQTSFDWDAVEKMRPKRAMRQGTGTIRGELQTDKYIAPHESRRRMRYVNAKARGYRIDAFLGNGFCIAWARVDEFWQGPCRRP
jgi:hypothetical protein